MPLAGSVQSFGVSEILQLISHQGKTGTLEIETSNGTARLKFCEGKLVEAWPDKRTPGELIGTLLVRAGLISPVQLGHALTKQRQNLRRIGDILIRMGAVRVSEFQGILTLQHRETVYQLLRLKRGRFHFTPESVELEEGISSSLDVGELLMEGFRQIDEWPKLLEQIPSEHRVYIRNPDAQLPPDLSAEESGALGLLDGVFSVREIVDRLRLGEFNGWAALARLQERGLLLPVRTSKRKTARVRPEPAVPRRLPDALAALALIALATVLLGFFVSGPERPAQRIWVGLETLRLEARAATERAREWTRLGPTSWPVPDQER